MAKTKTWKQFTPVLCHCKWDSRFDELFADYRMRLKNRKAAKSEYIENKAGQYVAGNNIFNQLWNWLRGN